MEKADKLYKLLDISYFNKVYTYQERYMRFHLNRLLFLWLKLFTINERDEKKLYKYRYCIIYNYKDQKSS